MSRFNVGDVVALKSGGPEMTVGEVDKDGDVLVVWFTKDGEVRTGTFIKEIVTKTLLTSGV